MSAPVPYLDLAGFTSRTVMPSGDVSLVQTSAPGFIGSRVAVVQALINSRLRKRYAIPFGAGAPPLVAQGAAPPLVTLSGIPSLGSMQIRIEVTLAGPVGVATFRLSTDGGVTWDAGDMTASAVKLRGTGLTATFSAGEYDVDCVYVAPTPVPETVLGWMTAILTPDVYRKRGVNPQDPQLELVEKDRERALAEIKEAADSQEGLFDLPVDEQTATTAISSGGPLAYTETSPYRWTVLQECQAREEDALGR